MRKAHFTNPARDLFHRIAQGAMQCDAHCSPREPRRADLMRKAAATREGVQAYVESKWATVEKEYNQLGESRRLSTIKRKKDEDAKKDRMQAHTILFPFRFRANTKPKQWRCALLPERAEARGFDAKSGGHARRRTRVRREQVGDGRKGIQSIGGKP